MNRLQFLRGNWQANAPIRPPWLTDETTFLENCTMCQDCVDVCDNKIIIKGSGGYPQIDFSRGECTFCKQCAIACKENIFDLNQSPPWNLQLITHQNCLALNRVVCRSCAEQCELDAFSFKLVVGGAAIPQVNLDLCNSCGACVKACPSHSIEFKNI